MTLVTCLAGLAARGVRRQGAILGSSATYAVVTVPAMVLLLYPGPGALGRYSGPGAIYLIVLLQLVHGFGFRAIRTVAKKSEETA